MTKQILIIGGLGYIGSVLYDIVKAEGWHVEILDNNLYKELKPANPYIDVDVRDKDALEKIIKKFDVIVNLL